MIIGKGFLCQKSCVSHCSQPTALLHSSSSKIIDMAMLYLNFKIFDPVPVTSLNGFKQLFDHIILSLLIMCQYSFSSLLYIAL